MNQKRKLPSSYMGIVLPNDLRAYVEKMSAKEHRSLGSAIKVLLYEAIDARTKKESKDARVISVR